MYPPIPPIRPIRGLGTAVAVMLGIVSLAEIFEFAVALQRTSLINAATASPESIDFQVLESNDLLYVIATGIWFVAYIATAVVFVIWLFRARSNAESITPIPHRRHPAWLIFGWVTPVVALWFPKQIVDDIWTTSVGGDKGFDGRFSLRLAPRSGLVWAWWLTWLITTWVANTAYRVASKGDELESLLFEAKIEIYLTLPTLICAVLAATVVLKITKMQDQRRETHLQAA